MKFKCKMFGHKMISPLLPVYVNQHTAQMGYLKTCSRCDYKDVEYIDQYEKHRVLILIRKFTELVAYRARNLITNKHPESQGELDFQINRINELLDILETRAI